MSSPALASAFIEHYRDKSNAGIDHYSARSLARVWKAERFSWWFTSLMHRFPETGEFGRKMQQAELDYLVKSEAAMRSMAAAFEPLSKVASRSTRCRSSAPNATQCSAATSGSAK